MKVSELINQLEDFKREHGDLPVVFEQTIPEENYFNVIRDSDFELEYDDGEKHVEGTYDPGYNLGPDNCPRRPRRLEPVGRRLGIGRTLHRLPIVERLDCHRAEELELTK